MTYDVISAFIDTRTGRQIDPGQPMPEGLERDTIERLVAARCLRPLEPETPAPAPGQPASNTLGGGADLFSGEENVGQDGAQPGGDTGEDPGTDDAAAAAQTVAPGGNVSSARRPRRSAAADVTP